MTKSRCQGSLLGLAVGDALGTTVEFKAPGTFPPLTDIVGGGPFNLERGQWTDDTSMALCLAESLVSCNGFDPTDQMVRYTRWRKEGYLSSNGRCFDIGNTVSQALGKFARRGHPYVQKSMRLPVDLSSAKSLLQLLAAAMW
ncbi:MAG: ADP-ribosylglycohydrolase family protein [Desulfatiglandaceae bacterium]